jgi:hypothetical protein
VIVEPFVKGRLVDPFKIKLFVVGVKGCVG